MKAPHATTTPDLLPDHDLAGERPAKQPRQAAWRDKNGLKALTVNIDGDLIDQFHERRKARGQTANEAIAHLLRTQYLRKR